MAIHSFGLTADKRTLGSAAALVCPFCRVTSPCSQDCARAVRAAGQQAARSATAARARCSFALCTRGQSCAGATDTLAIGANARPRLAIGRNDVQDARSVRQMHHPNCWSSYGRVVRGRAPRLPALRTPDARRCAAGRPYSRQGERMERASIWLAAGSPTIRSRAASQRTLRPRRIAMSLRMQIV